MFSTAITLRILLVILFISPTVLANNITNIINDNVYTIDEIKQKYFLIRHDIFSPKNSVSTNYGTYSDSLIAMSHKLRASRYEIFEKVFELDIKQNHLYKISKINLKSELLNNSISVLNDINKYYNTSNKNKRASFGDYKAQVKRLVTFEKLLYEME